MRTVPTLPAMLLLGSLVLAPARPGASQAAPDYDVGGPLAGLKLPLFPTKNGEPAGHPGCLPGKFATEDLAPEFELYPGAVEHYRNYWFKYCPSRSIFDRQSQLRNWTAPAIPGAGPGEQYAEPLYWVPRHADPVNTGTKLPPVPAIRCRPGAPTFDLDLGELERGVYAVRVIAAVETGRLRDFREPAYLRMEVNDGPQGETSSYRIRIGYCDEFYSVAEIYFHAPAKRAYRARLALDAGSKVELLVHNITLDDALAGVLRRPLKTRTTISDVKPPAFQGKTLSPEERRARDAALWEAFPPINAQGYGSSAYGGDEHDFSKGVSRGVPGKTAAEIEAEFGAWKSGGDKALLVNNKLGLIYTMDDLRQHRPLPDPYPYKDDGAGLFFPDPQNPDNGRIWAPIAQEVQNRIRDYPGSTVRRGTDRWLKTGDPDAARDAAVALIRFAYQFPALDHSNYLVCLARERGPYGRDYRCRRRDQTALVYPHYMMYVDPILYDYDAIFDTIRNNQELADSVGRFVPWVKTPADVVALIDDYLVQPTVKRILRYNYYTNAADIANAAAVVGDNAVTDPWMDWLFSRTFIYPMPPAGIQDTMITGCCRDGCQYIGSTFYAQGEGASTIASDLGRYLKAGGNRKYDLSDPERYPKPAAHCYWRLANVVAGADFTRVGDVTGPDKSPGYTLLDLGFARTGWQWTKDPEFAFVIRNYLARSTETDAEWAAIEEAAAKVKRAPWLDNRSRTLPMWAGILETGLQHDDARFRRAAYVRTGLGWGHQHSDTMDLQVVAQGEPATIDGGQRNGYSTPSDATTRVHNVVEVDGKGFQGYSWTRALSDAAGARYLRVQAEPPAGTTLFARQVALVDVDEGQGSQPLPVAQQKPGAKLPAGVTPANSYVFDVFRVAGGQLQTYCFHGTVNDDFQWNVAGAKPPAGEAAQYLSRFGEFPERKQAGTAPAALEATWQQTRGKMYGNERQMLGQNYSDDLPRRFTRLHLFDTAGARAMTAQASCFQWKYDFTNLMVQKTAGAGELQSAWAAVIEPYVGKPFLTGQRLLPVADNETDAQRAVAVEVKTANGHTDVCFADGRPEKTRRVPASGLAVAGEFAYYSTDAEGFRQATLTGGTLLQGPDVRLQPAQAERAGRVVRADHLKKSLWLDQPWPARSAGAAPANSAGGTFEIGSPGHWTSYDAVSVAPEGNGTRITVRGGADLFRSQVEKVDAGARTVTCTLGMSLGSRPGLNKALVASDDDRTTFWRAEIVGDRQFRLDGPPVTPEAFGKANALRLWEYGAGDTVRQSTGISLRRVEPGLFLLETDVDAVLSLKAGRLEVSTDRQAWAPLPGKKQGPWFVAPVKAQADAPVYVRVR